MITPESIQPGQQTPDGRIYMILQKWVEHERGWGTRPDGYSLHPTLADRYAYVNGYNAEFNNLSSAPDEYSEGHSTPYRVVTVTSENYTIMINAMKEPKNEQSWRRHGWMAGAHSNDFYEEIKP